MKNIYFITHFSQKFGLGHLKRCMNIAQYFKKKKTFFFNLDSKQKKKLHNINIYSKKEFSQVKKKNSINIIDLMPNEFYKNLQFLNHLNKNSTIVIDNGFKKKIVFKNTIYPYLKTNGIKSKYCGIKYFVINKEIINRVQKNTKKNRLLICMGGSDLESFTEKIMKNLNKINLETKVDIIIGPLFNRKHIQQIKQISKLNKNYVLHFNPKNLYQIISHSKLAFVNCGNIKYECFFLKVPIILISGKKDLNISKHFSKNFKTITKSFVYEKNKFLRLLKKLNINDLSNKKLYQKNDKIDLENYNKTIRLIERL